MTHRRALRSRKPGAGPFRHIRLRVAPLHRALCHRRPGALTRGSAARAVAFRWAYFPQSGTNIERGRLPRSKEQLPAGMDADGSLCVNQGNEGRRHNAEERIRLAFPEPKNQVLRETAGGFAISLLVSLWLRDDRQMIAT